MWVALWKISDPQFTENFERFKAGGYKLAQHPIGHLCFLLVEAHLMRELLEAEGIEFTDANLHAAMDAFDAAILDPEVLAQL